LAFGESGSCLREPVLPEMETAQTPPGFTRLTARLRFLVDRERLLVPGPSLVETSLLEKHSRDVPKKQSFESPITHFPMDRHGPLEAHERFVDVSLLTFERAQIAQDHARLTA